MIDVKKDYDGPSDLLKERSVPGSPGLIKGQKGTTTLAFRYQGGVVIAVDSRATTGQYIASQSVRKAVVINKYMMGTLAGGAADCQYFLAHLSKICNLYELQNRERISVGAAAKILSNILYSYRGYGLSMGSMISGYDNSGPRLYYIDNDGIRLESDLFSVGSGSTFAYGILDSEYKKEMSTEEACELARRAIFAATYKDSYSGGTLRVFHIGPNGWETISEEDVGDLYYEYEEKERGEGNGLNFEKQD